MAKPVFRRIAPANKRSDGYHYLDGNWMGRPMPMFEGQNLGVIVGAEGREAAKGLPIFLQAFHSDGTALTNGVRATIPKGKSITYDFGLQAMYLKRSGQITIRVTPDGDKDKAVEAVVETYPGALALFGHDLSSPLPTPNQIEALEAQTGHSLCAEHKRFLETRNGIDWTWWRDPVWKTAHEGQTTDFYKVMNGKQHDLPDVGLLVDATYLFGAGDVHPYLSYPENLGDFGFYDAAFVRFGIPVGVDAGGNLYVQILDGARRGEVVFLDHEYHFGMLDDAVPPQLAPDVRVGAPDKPLEQFTADEFWDHMDEVDYALTAAPSLDAMIETLTRHHTALREAMTPDWRKG